MDAGGSRSTSEALGAERARKIAAKLDRLIDREVTRASRRGEHPPTYRDFADRINRLAGRSVISRDTIRNIHRGSTQKGQAPNPTVDTLDWLGRGFGVQAGAGYFLDDAQTTAVDAQLDTLDALADLRQALGNTEVLSLLQRASTLSPHSVHTLVGLAERLGDIERGHDHRAT